MNNLHHHQSQQIHNPSISPSAALSGLTYQCFITNYTPTIGSWDLACDLDLSPRIVPFVTLLITENGLSSGDTYNLLLDFNLVHSSIKTSLEIIVANDEKEAPSDYTEFFLPLYNSISVVQKIFSDKFYTQYPARNRMQAFGSETLRFFSRN